MKQFFLSFILFVLLSAAYQHIVFQNTAFAEDTSLNLTNPISDYKPTDYLNPELPLSSPSPKYDAQTRNTLYEQGLGPDQCPYDDALCKGTITGNSGTPPASSTTTTTDEEQAKAAEEARKKEEDRKNDTVNQYFDKNRTINTDDGNGRPLINCGERDPGEPGILPGCTGEDALDTGRLVLGRFVPYLISWSIGIMGLVAFFFIVEAGIQLVLSEGNAEKAKAAQKTIIAAAIGLVIATLSFILVSIASSFNLL